MSAEKYAQWIVDNQSLQGTPEFETVAKAYQAAKEQSAPTLKQKVQASIPGRVVQGMRDAVDAGAQLLPRGLELATSAGGLSPNPVSKFFGGEAQRVDQMVSDNAREYEGARTATGQEGFDGARLVGNVFSPANAAIASKLPVAASTMGRVFQGAALGGVGGGLTPVDTQENPDFASTKAGQVALGAGMGAVATPIAGKVFDYVGKALAGRKSPSPVVLQKTTEEFARDMGLDWQVMAAKERSDLFEMVKAAAAGNTGKDPAAVARAADFKAAGIPYLTGQATRDPRQFAAEKNLSQLPGVGDDITARLSEQANLLRQKVGAFSAGATDEQGGGARLSEALRGFDAKKGKEVSAAYKAARESAGKDVELPMQGLAQDYADVLDRFGDKVPSGVRNQFRKYGIEPGGDMTQRKLFTVEEADKLLKVINDNGGSDKTTDTALTALRESVKRSVTTDGGAEDVFAPARKLAATRFGLQDAIPALESSASGRVNPDTFVQSFIVSKTAQTSQVQKLASLLKQEDPGAFSEARSQIGAYLQRKAFGENPAGDAKFNPAQYAKALRELGDAKLGAFFSPDEVTQLNRLGRIGAYVESVPAGRLPNTSGNWGAITQLAGRIPGVPSSIALAGALKNSVGNQMAASTALSGQLPTKMSAEDVRLMSQLLAGGSLASGNAGALPLR
ncbi:hypothetical protein [Hydrogenophaga sp.]|uniref:hypothetical protein n=1 Tax=Hydrogenophaga sp. TaxID=1904254 RepID=UPI00271C10F8|nr:hypothetical protein [Hydrogenophaga sp.]MDO9131963.1 hypothetical protein [Hydrogenophaga sp.]